MTSFVNLLGSDIWSEADIVARGRAVISGQVSEARQNELRTIMLGHIAQMRQATPEELGEIMLVQALTEQAALDNAAARADVALLAEVMAYEATGEGELSDAGQVLYALRNPAPEAQPEAVAE